MPSDVRLPDFPALAELKSRRQWVAWHYVTRNGRQTKPPINPHNGQGASHSDPVTWGTYEEAVECAKTRGLSGVGYVITEDDGITGADLDNCRSYDFGIIDDWAKAIVDLAETYTEVSPSGTGLRLIWRGKVDQTIKCDPRHVEIYKSLRYLTITGDHVPGTPTAIQPAPRTLESLVARVEGFRSEQAMARAAARPEPMLPKPGVLMPGPGRGTTFFKTVNEFAMRDLNGWVPALFGQRAVFQPATKAFRVSSSDLGRDLEEDLSIAPQGIVDFGVADMGDPRMGKRTPIDVVLEFGQHGTAKDAAFWICDRIGKDPHDLGWNDQPTEFPRFFGEPSVDPDPVLATEGIHATPFVIIPSTNIPPRAWVYGRHYIRKFLSTTVAPGGVGKTALMIVEMLAIVTGRPLLGVIPDERANVWIWNGEDPMEEMQRRIMAAINRHGILPSEVVGRLFVDTGRETPIVIATKTRDGAVINAPVIDQVVATIKANKIGVMTVDPFVSCHRVSENDNSEIERVAKAWSQIADITGCAIELVHHVRKTNGAEVSVEDGRGAVALLSAARAARAINRMTLDEAARIGIPDPGFYFRTDNGKSNLAPPASGAQWFKLESEDLDNATPMTADAPARPSDKVGVVVQWAWPDLTAGATFGDLVAVLKEVSGGKWRADQQATDWVGKAIMKAMGIADDKAGRATAKALQEMWTHAGRLVEYQDKTGARQSKTFVRAGEIPHE